MPPPSFSGAAAGGQLEEKIDLSVETDAKLTQCEQLVAAGQVREALVLLAAWEKKCRTSNDVASLLRVCEASLLHARPDHELLISTLTSLVSKRSQKTAAIAKMVQTALPWCIEMTTSTTLSFTPIQATTEQEKQQRLLLTQALLEITHGRIFLERERAQLTRAVAAIHEADGNIAAAAETLQDVHVETFGSLSKKEKLEYILEQLRLVQLKPDWVRANIVANKVSRKQLAEKDLSSYKITYFTLLAAAHRQEHNALELARDYHAIYTTVQAEDEAQWKPALEATVLFLALSPYSSEQQDLFHRLAVDTNLEKLPACQ
jgi:26S proteasome regulatory subunit N5